MKLPDKLIVDANPIISTLIGGAASRIFWDSGIEEFITSEWTLNEVKKYIPHLAKKTKVPESTIELNLNLLPLTFYTRSFYEDKITKATQLIGQRDPKDVELLALVLQLGLPLWTNDKDFEGLGIEYYPTAQLLNLMNHP